MKPYVVYILSEDRLVVIDTLATHQIVQKYLKLDRKYGYAALAKIGAL